MVNDATRHLLEENARILDRITLNLDDLKVVQVPPTGS